MKQIVSLIFLFIIISKSYGQDNKKSFLSQKENKEWIAKLEQIDSKELKINEIKNKIYYDRIYNVQKGACINFIYDTEYSKNIQKLQYECKIPFVLRLFDKYYLLDPNEFSNTFRILNQINAKDIDSIEIINDELKASAKWGFNGICGAVEIVSTSKKLKRKIKSIM